MERVFGHPQPPQACLVDFYVRREKMGLHQDRDEAGLSAPVVSVSLGDACLFRVGGTNEGERTVSFPRLESSDVVILGGEGRLALPRLDRVSVYLGAAEEGRGSI